MGKFIKVIRDFDWQKWRRPLFIAFISMAITQASLFIYHDFQWNVFQGVFFALYFLGVVFGSASFGFVFIYRVMLPVTVGLFAMLAYDQAYEFTWSTNFLSASRSNQEYLRWLFDILSTLYAICTAFLLWKGLTDHDTLRKLLSNEANYIERLVGYMRYFNLKNPTNREVACGLLENLGRYIDNITDGDEIKTSQENSEILRSCVGLVAKIGSSQCEDDKDENDKIALAETMKSLSDLAMARSSRISQMEIKMSPYLLTALGLMSLAVIYPFFTEAPSATDNVREMCIVILASLLSFLLITLLDISQPFNGFWQIKTDSFKETQDLINRERREIEAMN